MWTVCPDSLDPRDLWDKPDPPVFPAWLEPRATLVPPAPRVAPAPREHAERTVCLESPERSV